MARCCSWRQPEKWLSVPHHLCWQSRQGMLPLQHHYPDWTYLRQRFLEDRDLKLLCSLVSRRWKTVQKCDIVTCLCGSVDEVLQNRLEMAHELKLLTGSAHFMTGTELEDLRVHIKVTRCLRSFIQKCSMLHEISFLCGGWTKDEASGGDFLVLGISTFSFSALTLLVEWEEGHLSYKLEMWANAQRDGRPAEYRWCPVFNATKFGWSPLLECRAVTLPRHETHWSLQGCPKLANRSQLLVGQSSSYSEDMWGRHRCWTSFFRLSICASVAEI